MHIGRAIIIALAVQYSNALGDLSFNSSSISIPFNSTAVGGGGGGRCQDVWGYISRELSDKFLDRQTGQCNDDARAAIRAIFHDCGTWSSDQGNRGGCDGSLILAGEIRRPENNGLQRIAGDLFSLSERYNVGVADMIVFAAHHAVVTCPGGPRIRTWIGRRDSDIPARDGKLPNPHGSGDSLLRLFLAKGLSARELAALIGAHTCSRSFFQPPPGFGDQGFPQDTSPGVWDVRYYQQTINPPRDRIFRFESDVNLANHPTVGREFRGYIGNQGKWNFEFSAAMEKMSLFGVTGNLVDCTGFLPQPIPIRKTRRRSSVESQTD